MNLSCSSAVKRRNEVECCHQQADSITQSNDSLPSLSAEWSCILSSCIVADQHDHRNLTFLLCWAYVPRQKDPCLWSIQDWCLTIKNLRTGRSRTLLPPLIPYFLPQKSILLWMWLCIDIFFSLLCVWTFWAHSVQGLSLHVFDTSGQFSGSV